MHDSHCVAAFVFDNDEFVIGIACDGIECRQIGYGKRFGVSLSSCAQLVVCEHSHNVIEVSKLSGSNTKWCGHGIRAA